MTRPQNGSYLRDKALYLGLVALLFSFIDYSYTSIDATIYRYFGFFDLDPSGTDYTAALLLALLPGLWLSHGWKRPSDLILQVFYVGVFVPTVAVSAHFYPVGDPVRYVQGASLLGALIVTDVCRRLHCPRISIGRISPTQAVRILSVITVATAILLVFGLGKGFQLSYTDIYARRAEAKDIVHSTGHGIGYLIPTVSTVFCPICMALGIILRQPLAIVSGLLGALGVYSFEGSRSVLVYTFVIPLACGLSKYFRGPRTFLYGLLMLNLVVVGCIELGTWNGNDSGVPLMPYTAIVQRNLNVKGYITCCFFDYAYRHGPTYFSIGLFSTLSSDLKIYAPSDLGFDALIGSLYFNFDDPVGANCNAYGGAYAVGGTPYLLFIAAILGLMMGYLDGLETFELKALFTGIVISLSNSWSNLPLENTMLTNGVLVLFVLLTVIRPAPPATLPAKGESHEGTTAEIPV